MSIQYYDEAVYNKINGWVKDKNLMILKPEETTRLFQNIADKNEDRPITLPLIAISRESEITINNANKQPLTFDGMMLQANRNNTLQLDAIPITLRYQLDIYTRRLVESSEYIRNFVFNLLNYPRIEIEIPYNNLKMKHYSNIRLDTSIVDNSGIKEKLFPDEFTRFTISFYIDDAYLFNAPIRENVEMSDTFTVDAKFEN